MRARVVLVPRGAPRDRAAEGRAVGGGAPRHGGSCLGCPVRLGGREERPGRAPSLAHRRGGGGCPPRRGPDGSRRGPARGGRVGADRAERAPRLHRRRPRGREDRPYRALPYRYGVALAAAGDGPQVRQDIRHGGPAHGALPRLPFLVQPAAALCVHEEAFPPVVRGDQGPGARGPVGVHRGDVGGGGLQRPFRRIARPPGASWHRVLPRRVRQKAPHLLAARRLRLPRLPPRDPRRVRDHRILHQQAALAGAEPFPGPPVHMGGHRREQGDRPHPPAHRLLQRLPESRSAPGSLGRLQRESGPPGDALPVRVRGWRGRPHGGDARVRRPGARIRGPPGLPPGRGGGLLRPGDRGCTGAARSGTASSTWKPIAGPTPRSLPSRRRTGPTRTRCGTRRSACRSRRE